MVVELRLPAPEWDHDTLATMDIDLAGRSDGVSERFVPDIDHGHLIEAEHLARYRWASQAVEGRSVLDAACGVAYGSRMLAQAGAREVIGVDLAAAVLTAVESEMPPEVQLRPGDLHDLEFEDGRFEVIVCFEAIEHITESGVVLDELRRVLAPGGLLLISSPNRGVYPDGNPHHLHELTVEELSEELNARFRHVQLFHQDDFLASAVYVNDELRAGEEAEIRWHGAAPDPERSELYVVAAASDGDLPPLHSVGQLGGTLELSGWLSAISHLDQVIAERERDLSEARARVAEADAVASALAEAEQRLAIVPEFQQRIEELQVELATARGDAAQARTELAQLDRLHMYLRRALRLIHPYIRHLKALRRKLRER